MMSVRPSLSIVLFVVVLACCAVACGARQTSAAVAVEPAPDTAQPPEPPKPERTSRKDTGIARPAAARTHRPFQDGSASPGGPMAPAAGVHLAQWKKHQQALREQRYQHDPEVRAAADQANLALESELSQASLASLRKLEDDILAEINRLRANPPAYADTVDGFRVFYRDDVVYIPGHPPVRTEEGTAAVDDAVVMARATAPMPPLARSPGLTRAARAHAYELGRGGAASGGSVMLHHRMQAYGRVQGMFAENVSTLYREANVAVLNLFVDDGVESRANRYNMLGPMFRVAGVGCAPHARYEVVCIMDFAEVFHQDPAED